MKSIGCQSRERSGVIDFKLAPMNRNQLFAAFKIGKILMVQLA